VDSSGHEGSILSSLRDERIKKALKVPESDSEGSEPEKTKSVFDTDSEEEAALDSSYAPSEDDEPKRNPKK
jgi:hypothetical protein